MAQHHNLQLLSPSLTTKKHQKAQAGFKPPYENPHVSEGFTFPPVTSLASKLNALFRDGAGW